MHSGGQRFDSVMPHKNFFMKKEEVEKGKKVSDRWYPDWGTGIITKVMKTRFVVSFGGTKLRYDYPHAQFLMEEK